MKKIVLLVLIISGLGCSSDDGSEAPVPDPEVADFIVIGEDFESVFQYSFNGDSETGQLTNLTVEQGILPNYLTLRQEDNALSFYTFANDVFSLTQLDLITGASVNYPDFFPVTEERSIAWGTNTSSNVFFGFFGPFGARDLSVRDVELSGTTVQDQLIDVDVEVTFQPLLFEGKIYITYRDNAGNYKLSFYDTVTKTTGRVLNFELAPISILIDNTGNLAVIKNTIDASLEIYDADNLDLIESLPLDLNSGFLSGPVDGAVLKDNTLFYAIPYVQPARYPFGPASFDLNSQEINIIDFFRIGSEVETELGTNIEPTTLIFDPVQDMFLLGYAVLNGNESPGGVLQISAEGALVANISLPFFPTYFSRN